MKLRLILTPIVLLLILSSFAQGNEKYYTYDNAGNRTLRGLLVKSMDSPPKGDGDELAEEGTAAKSIEETESTMRVYPNPNYGIINIEIELEKESQVTLTLYDLAGKQLLKHRERTTGSMRIDITDQVSGEYILKVQSKKQTRSWTIIKQ